MGTRKTDDDERAFIASESDARWDHDPPGPGDTAGIRWRTLVSSDRTPSSGIAMGVLEIPPGSRLAPHRHPPQEVYYVTAGEGEVFLDGAWRPVRQGDVVYFPAGDVHGARNRGGSGFRIVWIFPTDDYEAVVYEDVEVAGDAPG